MAIPVSADQPRLTGIGARSLNSVAVQVTQKVGPPRVADAARRLGITSAIEAAPSVALGTSEVSLLELTAAYAVFANGGFGVWPGMWMGIARTRTVRPDLIVSLPIPDSRPTSPGRPYGVASPIFVPVGARQ